MLLQQTFTYNSGWDEDVYPENEGEVYGEELTMEVGTGSSGSNAQVSIADEEERGLDAQGSEAEQHTCNVAGVR